jgi:hypothetical protein
MIALNESNHTLLIISRSNNPSCGKDFAKFSATGKKVFITQRRPSAFH